jgi:hypothetical protein
MPSCFGELFVKSGSYAYVPETVEAESVGVLLLSASICKKKHSNKLMNVEFHSRERLTKALPNKK